MQNEWDKNAPHPVGIAPDKPYILPNWVEGDDYKSLKSLGVDATQKGNYKITGLYEETHQPIQNNNPEIWGGVVRSNTLTISRE